MILCNGKKSCETIEINTERKFDYKYASKDGANQFTK